MHDNQHSLKSTAIKNPTLIKIKLTELKKPRKSIHNDGEVIRSTDILAIIKNRGESKTRRKDQKNARKYQRVTQKRK